MPTPSGYERIRNMASVIYSLCALLALLCAVLLLQAYLKSRYRLLLWGGLCITGLTLSNALLVIDKLVIEDIDFSLARLITAFAAMSILLYGLIWDTE